MKRILKKISSNENEKYRHNVTVFLMCLGISTFIWMLIKLSGQYTTEITIPITYNQIPEGKILVNHVDTIITIGVSDRGFALTWLKYFTRKAPLNIDLEDFRFRQRMHQYEALISTKAWSQSFLDQYALAGKVTYIVPDTIAFYFEDRYSKVVPVKPNLSINFKKQFFAYDSLVFSPDSVTITGLNKTIKSITFIKTVASTFTDLSTSIHQNLALQTPFNDPNIEIIPNEIELKLTVEKFTESEIKIPIIKRNQPGDMKIKIFPQDVSIKYLVALDDYKKITPEMFNCLVDLSKINDGHTKKLEVLLKNHPQNIKIVSIVPAELDYLVLK